MLSQPQPLPARRQRASPDRGLSGLLNFQQILGSTSAPILVLDACQRICYVNSAYEVASGYGLSDIAGTQPPLFQEGAFSWSLKTALETHGQWSGLVWCVSKVGITTREWLDLRAIARSTGEPAFYVATYRGAPLPVTQDVQGPDPLTGLMNRSLFLAHVSCLASAETPVTLVTLDIESFRRLNETTNSAFGDNLLKQVAERCNQVLKRSGMRGHVARIGADEFALAILDRRTTNRPGLAFVQKLQVAMAEPFQMGGKFPMLLQFSFGEHKTAGGSETAASALKKASQARLSADRPGEPVHRFAALDNDSRMVAQLQQALVNGDIRVAYQPQLDIHSGQVIGVEALARWTLDDQTEVPPSVFIPMAERRHLILSLGEQVLDQSLRDLAHWDRTGLVVPRVAVNFSAAQFNSPGAGVRVRKLLKRHGLGPQRLELELTESILLGNIDVVMANLQDLHRAGVQLSIDDFGTGYSSLAYLRRFPIDRLKIDRSFIDQMHEDAGALEIVLTIVKLAHRFGLRCLAEGISSEAHRETLQLAGCDEGQGYLYAKPMMGHLVPDWVRQQNAQTAS